MSIVESTADYEEWLGSQTTLVAPEIQLKHQKMAGDPFPFLRATYYRWSQLFPTHCSELNNAPRVLGVGDLHIENFGTWRDKDGRLAWGVNDFDEACMIPYTNDLVRLACSAYFALADKASGLSLDFDDACKAIQTGYLRGLAKPMPFILAENHRWLRDVVMKRLVEHDPLVTGRTGDDVFDRFCAKYTTLTDVQSTPEDAEAALTACCPKPVSKFKIKHRVAGLGSLGRQRFTGVITDWQGGIIVREAKALVPSAWLWANKEHDASDAAALAEKRLYYSEILARSVRAADPWLRIVDRWVVRRLGPDAFKVEVHDLGLKRGAEGELTRKLFEAMGREVGNIHSPSRPKPEYIQAHMKGLPVRWLVEGSTTMVKLIQDDFHHWRKHVL
jgi:hypothetical protein